MTYHIPGLRHGMHQHPTKKVSHGMQPVFEIGDDAELPAAAAESPEQIGILVLAGGEEVALGCDDVGADQIVAGHAMQAHEPAYAAAERQAGDAGLRNSTAGGG